MIIIHYYLLFILIIFIISILIMNTIHYFLFFIPMIFLISIIIMIFMSIIIIIIIIIIQLLCWQPTPGTTPCQESWFIQVSSEKNPRCLGYIGQYTTQLYRDYDKPL